MKELPKQISLVMRSYNEAWALDDTLHQVFSQDYDGGIELIVIDSGSTDGSIDIINRYKPAKLFQIRSQDYVPGRVLNRGMKQASCDWVVFLNSDATPANKYWLCNLLRVAVSQTKLGAVFSRQIPRPDCLAVYAHDYERCFGPQRESKNWNHFFSMVSCVVSKSAWQEEPFREDLQYAEDDEWSRRLKRAGYRVLFAPESIAVHSHNYTLKQAYRRAFGDAKAMAATSTTDPRHVNLHYTVLLSSLRDFQRDLSYHRTQGKWIQAPHSLLVRIAQRFGRYRGFHAGWKEYRGAKMP